ncbi:MAG TPA: hypothetical protein VN081_06490 [Dongiaceae bacterium]|nr:hypothetical protein [Dongiaceae bacterium]
MATLASLFGGLGKALVIDQALVRRLHNYRVAFVNRNEAHIAFFGGNLLGVHPVRFRTSDRQLWFDSVVKMDELEVKDGLLECPAIDPSFKVSSDTFNESCIWLMHALWVSKLPEGIRISAATDVALILQYKLISSLMAHYFPYDADEATAIATYAELSRKFALKQYGSWGKLLEARAEDIVGASSIHAKTWRAYDDDKAVVYMINDIQGRLRETVNSLCEVFYRVKESGKKFALVSSTIEHDGLQVVRDKTSNYQTYTRYLKEILGDQTSFIRGELTGIVCDAMHTMPPKLFEEVLVWLCVNHTSKHPEVDQLVDGVLNHAYDYVTHSRELNANRVDIGLLIARLRALYMASRMADPALITCKLLADKVVSQAVKTKNPSILASLRTGTELYVVLRSFARSYYL